LRQREPDTTAGLQVFQHAYGLLKPLGIFQAVHLIRSQRKKVASQQLGIDLVLNAHFLWSFHLRTTCV
jgi:hypothetical protein